jgi:hypothetical protein
MNENVKKFVTAVEKQDYAAARTQFQSAMATKIDTAFENKKIELAKNMTEGTIEEKKTRQLDDPENEVMVVKNGKVEVIDEKDLDKFMKKGYELAEETEND